MTTSFLAPLREALTLRAPVPGSIDHQNQAKPHDQCDRLRHCKFIVASLITRVRFLQTTTFLLATPQRGLRSLVLVLITLYHRVYSRCDIGDFSLLPCVERCQCVCAMVVT